MYKGIVAGFTALIVSVSMLGAQAAAQNPIKISVVAGYAKANGTFDVVVKDTPGTHLVMYVNDASPSKANVNKKDYATFRHVQLSGTGKLSFAKVLRGSAGKSYKKPINYSQQYTVANGQVTFSAPAVAAAAPAPAPAPAPTPTPAPAPAPTCTNGSYVNSARNTVCSPESSSSGAPAGATAKCGDGTYSFSQSHSGTCSHHGGVAQWL